MNTHSDTLDLIENLLQAQLDVVSLDITDESYLHIGHAHAGAGHFAVCICAHQFKGLSLLVQHRLVYQALSSLMPKFIHALRIIATAPP